MASFLRILTLAIALFAAFIVFHLLWTRTTASPAELRVHVSVLAFGFTLLIGTALQEIARVIVSRSAAEIPSVTIIRLIATMAATTGYLFGVLWATNYGRYDVLLRPVMFTDTIVIGFAWFVTTHSLRKRPMAYWDIPLGLGALSSWYVSTLL